MKNIKKLFVYEAKRILFIPLLFLTLSVISETYNITDTIHYSMYKFNIYHVIACEETSLNLLYVFCALLFLCYSYNLFALRKLYEKARIDERKLFLVRLCLISLAIIVYLVLVMFFNTLHLGASIRETPADYYASDHLFIFALQGKPWWYAILFPVSVAFTTVMACSIMVFIQKLIFSKMHFAYKIVTSFFLIASVSLTPRLIYFFADLTILGVRNMFIPHLPMGTFTYKFYSEAISSITAVPERANPVVALCHISWNINNYFMLLWGLAIIMFCYFSISFFNNYQNQDYSYKKEIRK